jgi:hypothetical protein
VLELTPFSSRKEDSLVTSSAGVSPVLAELPKYPTAIKKEFSEGGQKIELILASALHLTMAGPRSDSGDTTVLYTGRKREAGGAETLIRRIITDIRRVEKYGRPQKRTPVQVDNENETPGSRPSSKTLSHVIKVEKPRHEG